MEHKRLFWLKVSVLLSAVPALLWANSGLKGALAPGYSGVPGENGGATCTACHTGVTNDPANHGSVSINFLQSGLTYSPNVTQQLSVTITEPASSVRGWGFQLTARQASATNTVAGSFTSNDTQTEVICSQAGLTGTPTFINFGAGTCPASSPLQYVEQSQVGYSATQNTGSGSVTFFFNWTPPATNVGNVIFYIAAVAANNDGTAQFDHSYATSYTLAPASAITNTYYFPHLALGGGWQTVLTYVNYSQQAVTCETNFIADNGTPLLVNFGGTSSATRTDVLAPGAEIHQISQNDPASATVGGWAQGQCTGPLKASLLFRNFVGGVATTEASVNASTIPTTKFVTYGQVAATATGVAISNPSATQSATVNLMALDSFGVRKGSTTKIIKPGNHFADTVNSIFGLNSFTGSVQVSSDNPVVSLSINAEASPNPQQLVVSSLPPGDLDLSTQLANGSGFGNPPASTFNYTYYFPHFAVSGNWQTVLIYVNYSLDNVQCKTNFMDTTGAPLAVPFAANTSPNRTDNIPSGGELHDISTADPTKPLVSGWAIGSCTGPVKASLLFRYYPNGITAAGEAAVNASTTGTTRFVSFAQSVASGASTGLAYANISASPASVTIVAVDSTGAQRGSTVVNLPAGGHDSKNLGPLLGLGNFTGSVQIISTQSIINLELNAEAFPVFSSLPAGDLAPNTPLSTGF